MLSGPMADEFLSLWMMRLVFTVVASIWVLSSGKDCLRLVIRLSVLCLGSWLMCA